MNSNVYILAPNCIVVKGFTRYCLLDLQRQTFRIIDKNQQKLISFPIKEKKVAFCKGNNKIFLSELINADILIRIPKSATQLFPKMSDQFHNSTKINNFIFELNPVNIQYQNKIISSLNNLGCKFIELRVSGNISINDIIGFFKTISKTTIQCVDLYYEYKSEKTYSKLLQLKNEIFEIRWLYIYNTPIKFIDKMKNKVEPGTLLVKHSIIDKTNCGTILPFYFAINIPTYTESVHYNSCLNCKISIDNKGEIKNCPSIKESFGNIKNISLEDALKSKNFSEFGSIKKDQIAGCKDCEFRYICTDCRAYLEDPNNIYSKPLKCGYNPYTGIWEEWSKNPLKQKAIKFYGMEKLVKK